jgi:AraC-like DNA-binding protein
LRATHDAAGKTTQRIMTPDNFATGPHRARDQFEAWLEWYRPVFDVVPMQPADLGFHAEIHLWQLGGLALTRTTAPPVQVVRSKRHLRHYPVDHWVVSYCARGAHAASTAGNLLEVPAKVPFIWSLGQEFVHERTHVDRIQFILSRDAFRDIAPPLDEACGSLLDTPLGHLLGDYMLALERHLPAITEADFPRLTNAVGAMVAAAVAPSAERVAIARRQIDLGRKERVRQAVRRHLRTPTLGPRTLSRLVGMSRSNLYRLFEGSGGVARYIQNERLSEAHAILIDPVNHKSISGLAEELCFADASSFNRSFKREFGCSPGEARSAALAGLAPPGMRHGGLSPDQMNFGGLLRRF